jgi:thiamine pyrophosphate-dependent acetolactate synthase large subunit-like protein
MQRIDVIRAIAPLVTPEDLLTTSLGATMNDWWNHQPADNALFVGTLGSVTTTALGMAVSVPHRRVIAIESDGGVLFNLGVLCTLGAERPANLTVLVMDNGMYESIGGPATHSGRNSDIAGMAAAAGCINCRTVTEPGEIGPAFSAMLDDGEFGYLVAKIEPGAYPWPDDKKKPTDGVEDKYRFIRYVERLENKTIHGGALHY